MLSFIRGLQSFNTELLLGTPAGIYVYSTKIYDLLQHEPRAYGEATALGSVFLFVLALLLFFYWKFLRGGKKFTVVTGQGYSTLRVKLGKWRYIAFAGCLLYVAVTMLLPLAFLVIGSFMRRYGFFNIASPFTLIHWYNMLSDPIFLVALKNSLIIASIDCHRRHLALFRPGLFIGFAAHALPLHCWKVFVGYLMCCRGFF